MATLLNAVLASGLMNVPVGVCSATKRKDFEFRTLHKTCLEPIQTEKQCAHCQQANLGSEDLVKGFEFTKGNFVALDSAVLDRVSAGRSKVIQVKKFVPWEKVDDLQVEKSYFLSPSGVLVRPYQLLSNAMGSKEVVGVGSSSLWGKEYPCMVWSRENGTLVLSLLYCYDEVQDDSDIVNKLNGSIPAVEQELANEFVAVMMRDYIPEEDLVSKSRDRILEYVSSVVTDQTFDPQERAEELEPTLDIVKTLRESIEIARSAA